MHLCVHHLRLVNVGFISYLNFLYITLCITACGWLPVSFMHLSIYLSMFYYLLTFFPHFSLFACYKQLVKKDIMEKYKRIIMKLNILNPSGPMISLF